MNSLACSAPFTVAVIVAGLSLGLSVGLADELPAETNKIESLSVEQARRLVKEFRGLDVKVEFHGVGNLWCFQCLPLNGLKSLNAETAEALAGYARGPLLLNGLTTLSGDAATALAQRNGELYLNGLTTLSGDAATALAQHNGALYLNGLTRLSDEAAKALAQKTGSLSIDGLTTLSPEAAAALAAAEKWTGFLPRVTAFDSSDSVAVALALATKKGRLSLPNLEKLSPKTLTALIQKEDVEIPLIETLELIPEPDGSPTDDFIIPKWLEDRQEKQRRLQPPKQSD